MDVLKQIQIQFVVPMDVQILKVKTANAEPNLDLEQELAPELELEQEQVLGLEQDHISTIQDLDQLLLLLLMAHGVTGAHIRTVPGAHTAHTVDIHTVLGVNMEGGVLARVVHGQHLLVCQLLLLQMVQTDHQLLTLGLQKQTAMAMQQDLIIIT